VEAIAMNDDIGAEYRQRAARYGTEQVPVQRLREHFDRVAALASAGFEPTKPGAYARSVEDGIVQLAKLMTFKDGTCSLQWGVSLPWMPHEFSPKPKWHRTLKSARMDLFEWPVTLETAPGESPNDWHVSLSHGPQYMALTYDAMWQRLRPRMHTFFERVRTAPAVMAAAHAQCAQTLPHDPDPRLVLAFTAARLANPPAAADALDRYWRERGDYAPAPREVIAALLLDTQRTATNC
jgi:hypothetical protein